MLFEVSFDSSDQGAMQVFSPNVGAKALEVLPTKHLNSIATVKVLNMHCVSLFHKDDAPIYLA